MGNYLGKILSDMIPAPHYVQCPLHSHNGPVSMNSLRTSNNCNLNGIKKEIKLFEKLEYIPGISNVVGSLELVYGIFEFAKGIINLPLSLFKSKEITVLSGLNHIGRGIIANIPIIGNLILYTRDSFNLEHYIYGQFLEKINDGKFTEAEEILRKYPDMLHLQSKYAKDRNHTLQLDEYEILIDKFVEIDNFAKAKELNKERSKYYRYGEQEIESSLMNKAQLKIKHYVQDTHEFDKAKMVAESISCEQIKKEYLRSIAISENAYKNPLPKKVNDSALWIHPV